MAGIGFELKKLFVGQGVLKKLRAYAFASIICSGTMLLAIALLLGIQAMIKSFEATQIQLDIFTSTFVHSLLLSMLLTACMQTYLSRYVADQIYNNNPERVMPSLLGASLIMMIPGGIFYAWMLSTADALTLFQKLLNWVLFMELIPIWLQMSYITAAKDYQSVLNVFVIGIGLALAVCIWLMLFGVDVITAPMLGLVTGYGFMLAGFMYVLLGYFPVGSGSCFRFIRELSRYGDMLITGFLSMAGIFVHIIIMWYSPIGQTVTGVFRHAAMFDAASFYAFLVMLPANVNFIISVEVNFYNKYRHYFDAVVNGGTIAQLNHARDDMKAVLKQEISKLTQVQVFFMVIYIVSMRYLLPVIGFTAGMTGMFQVMCIGYSAYSIGNSLMFLQLYFNDRKGAMISTAVLFLANLAISLFTLSAPSYLYGLGIAVAGIAMYLVALPRLLWYIHRINFRVYCSQPVFPMRKDTRWMRLADRLDARAARGERKYRGESGKGA